MWQPGSGGGRGRAGRGGRRAPLNSAAPAWRGRRPDRGRAGAAGTAHGPGRDASAVRGYMRGTPTPTALTFSSVCTNWSTGMEPLSRGFRTLQSGMSSLARFRFLPPVGWAGLGRRKTGVSSRNQPGAPGPCRPPAGPSSLGGHRAWPGAAVCAPCQGLCLQLDLHTVHTSRGSYPQNHHLSWQRYLPFSKIRF